MYTTILLNGVEKSIKNGLLNIDPSTVQNATDGAGFKASSANLSQWPQAGPNANSGF
jgi:hypothetical protein